MKKAHDRQALPHVEICRVRMDQADGGGTVDLGSRGASKGSGVNLWRAFQPGYLPLVPIDSSKRKREEYVPGARQMPQ